MEYGDNVIQLSDEGDKALRYQLLHSALGSYIHAIEWSIICYFEDKFDKDFIEEEIENEFGYYYGQLVNKISAGSDDNIIEKSAVTQKTQEELDLFETYRYWMGHHKTGTLTRANVIMVKERLEILLGELFS